MNLNLMSFNLRMDTSEDGNNQWKFRRKSVIKMIQRHNPIIFGTQEGFLPMLEDVKDGLSNYQWIGQSRRGNSEDEFSAIFYDISRLECVDQGQFWLSTEPHQPDSVSWDSALPRICTWGHFRFKEEPNTEFMFYNTHLDHMGTKARINGTFLIWEHMEKQRRADQLPIILTGDFNSEPDSLAIRFLDGQVPLNEEYSDLQNANYIGPDSNTATFHNFSGGNNGEMIDYIFCSPDIHIQKTIIDQSAIDDTYPSDHYPVISKINFK